MRRGAEAHFIPTIFSKYFDRAVSNAIFLLQHFHTVDGLQHSSVCGTFQVDDSRKVHRHHAACIVVDVITKQIGRRTAVNFVSIA